jgi:Protein of unknown function (DUF1553)/Protein of unknown function (DUF1549)/Planctomycete cytochrome C/Concanavalin A-like lectin/glucanases superfamily
MTPIDEAQALNSGRAMWYEGGIPRATRSPIPPEWRALPRMRAPCMKTSTLLVLACLSMVTVPASRGDDRPASGFDASVATILARRCLDCHSGPEPKGKLDLSRRSAVLEGGEGGPAIVPGRPDQSPLWERVEAGEMPPKAALPEDEKVALREWIAAGASWGTDPIDAFRFTTTRRAGRDWWSLRPVGRPEVPAASDPKWARSPIDRFVLKKLGASGLSPAPEADRRALIRRLSFDLTGLPPTPEEVENFVADPSPVAYENLVDRLLGSPQYGVRWARWWLDLARFGESNGFEFDEFRRNAWRYRDWVVDALNRDLPYDEFARLQVAGDVLRPDDPPSVEATGFLVAGAFDTVGQNQISQVMKAVVRADELEDVIGTVSQAFLGLTIHCARCHDHKFDPIRQAEYYRLASALGGVRQGERDLSAIDPEIVATGRKIESLAARLEAIEAPVRARIRADRKDTSGPAPRPVAAWNFDRGLDDAIGPLKLSLQGGATLTPGGLRLDGTSGFAASPPLARKLKAKTIEAWVRLDDLNHRGGGVLSIQSLDGQPFDAIVFGEQEPSRWMAGSDNFVRTRSVGGEAEPEATRRPVHVAITYAEDGKIRLYRDGKPYGKAYTSTGPVEFPAEKSQVVFGLRHSPAGLGKMLAGTILRARLYDRALDPSEVVASVASSGDYVSSEAIAGALTPEVREDRARLLDEIGALRTSKAGRVHKAHAVTPRDPGTTHVEIRGNPGQPGSEVSAGGVSAVAGVGADFGLPPDAPEAERRKRLASWITHPANPLFARVVVNRLWQAHFGTGLVETPSDLGFNGGTPSHPELLDWLASEVRDLGWSLKAMHRLIVTSATYRQSSRPDPAASSKDAGDRLLWRKAPSRLEAEMVRDAMLAVSGKLDPRLGGPSFMDHAIFKPAGAASLLYVPARPETPGLDRRTLFRAWSRGGRSTLLDAFDCPDPSATSPRRPVTTTPLQALSMMNNALVLHLSDTLADRLAREAGPDAGRQVDRAYRLAFGRSPDPEERSRVVRVVERFGAATMARALFNSGEFFYLD